MKNSFPRLVVVFCLVAYVVAFSAFNIIAAETAVNDVSYSDDGFGGLHISGTGEMAFGDLSWNTLYNYKSQTTYIRFYNNVTGIAPDTFSGFSKLESVYFVDSVTTIGDKAFSGCSSLENITLPEGMTYIGAGAFLNCSSLSEIIIPSNITSIYDSTFSGCTGLTSITIPEGVTSIGAEAFKDCSSLTSITIPDSVTSIGDNAFQGCKKLISVTIPEGVTSISSCAFSGCNSLTSITIPDSVTSIDTEAFSDCSSLTSITIPDSVTSIGDNAFSGCSNLTNLTIPDNMTSIGLGAFSSCNGLQDENGFIIVNGILFDYVGEGGEVIIPDNVTQIGYQAFYNCTSVTSLIISDSVTSIGDRAFNACSGLISITFGSNVKSVGEYAFVGCGSLINVYINDLGNWCSINFSNWFATPMLYAKNVYVNNELLTELVVPDGVTAIGDYAFYNYDSLTSINIPNSVTTIGRAAFRSCDGIISITIPENVLTIRDDAFSMCSMLTQINWNAKKINDFKSHSEILYETGKNNGGFSLIFGENVEKIPAYLCYEAYYLNNIIIGENVRDIGDCAFSGCSRLTNVTIPDTLISIGKGAFSGCTKLTSIAVPFVGGSATENTFLGYIFGASEYSENAEYVPEALKEIVISDACTSIAKYAFYDCKKIEQMTLPFIGGSATENTFLDYIFGADINTQIPKGLKSVILSDKCTFIDDYAFSMCLSLENVTIPEGVTSIGDYAFNYCESLTSITIPDSVTSIGKSAFRRCGSLTSITIPEGVTSIGDYAFCDCGSLTSITIPDSVTSIGDLAFYFCESLTSITIPEGVTSIGERAFDYCKSLTSITIPDSVTSIGIGAFLNCSSITSVTIPFIGGSATENTFLAYIFGASSHYDNSYVPESLKKVVVTEECTSIDDSAFYACFYIESIILPKDITKIGKYAFRMCYRLKSLNIPDSVTSIGDYAFHYCESLTSITIPENVTTIENGTFDRCTQLKSITILGEMTHIGDSAFDNCNALTDVYYANTLVKWDNLSKGDNNAPLSSATIHTNGIAENEVNENLIWSISDDKALTITGTGEMTQVPWNNYTDYFTTVVISEGITTICDNAFSGCKITSVNIPESVTAIGKDSFYNCNSLKGVYVKSIENWCNMKFANLEANPLHFAHNLYENDVLVTEIEFLQNTTEIKKYLFSGCSALTKVTIPDSVTDVGDYAFNECNNLTDVYYDNTLTKWNSLSVGQNNDALSRATVHTNGITGNETAGALSWNISLDGILTVTGIGEMTIAPWNDYSSYFTTVIIENGVMNIIENAFADCSNIQTVTIADSITQIGKDAFKNCDNLTDVHCKSLVKWNNILIDDGNNHLTGATLNYDTIADNEKASALAWSIGKNDRVLIISQNGDMDNYGADTQKAPWLEYSDYFNNVIIENAVKSIGDCAFYNCTELESVKFGDTVTRIGNNAFYNCELIEEVKINGNNVVIGDRAFAECMCLWNIDIKDCEYIGDEAFLNDISLSNFSLGDAVEFVGKDAFKGTYYYKNTRNWNNDVLYLGSILVEANNVGEIFNVEDGTSVIAYGAFYDSNLNGVILPDTLKGISDCAFYSCNNLTSVEIPENVEIIGHMAFYDNGVTSVTIPDATKSIGEDAFYACSFLEKFIVGEDNRHYRAEDGVLYDYYRTKLICYPSAKSEKAYNIPSTVKTICANAFYNNSNIEEIGIPLSVTAIGDMVFNGCNLTYVNYEGTPKQWQEISISTGNDALNNALIGYRVKLPENELVFKPGIVDVTVSNTEDAIVIEVSVLGEGEVIAMGIYDGVQKVVKVVDGRATFPKGTTDIKVIMWESFESMTPICRAIEIK